MRKLLLVVALAGCWSPTMPEGAYRIDPWPVHWAALDAINACLPEVPFFDLHLSMPPVWLVPDVDIMNNVGFDCGHDFRCAGMSNAGGIYLAESHASNDLVIGHELLHQVIDDGDHCSPLWDSCGVRSLPCGDPNEVHGN